MAAIPGWQNYYFALFQDNECVTETNTKIRQEGDDLPL